MALDFTPSSRTFTNASDMITSSVPIDEIDAIALGNISIVKNRTAVTVLAYLIGAALGGLCIYMKIDALFITIGVLAWTFIVGVYGLARLRAQGFRMAAGAAVLTNQHMFLFVGIIQNLDTSLFAHAGHVTIKRFDICETFELPDIDTESVAHAVAGQLARAAASRFTQKIELRVPGHEVLIQRTLSSRCKGFDSLQDTGLIVSIREFGERLKGKQPISRSVGAAPSAEAHLQAEPDSQSGAAVLDLTTPAKHDPLPLPLVSSGERVPSAAQLNPASESLVVQAHHPALHLGNDHHEHGNSSATQAVTAHHPNGTPVAPRLSCSDCGWTDSADSRFCTSCGSSLNPQELLRQLQQENRSLKVFLGRDTACAVALDSQAVSSVHARVTLANGNLHIEDYGSVNGTWVNSSKVTAPRKLESGDDIRLGRVPVSLARITAVVYKLARQHNNPRA